MKYHVSKTGSDRASGTEESPFLTISKAAQVAAAGDEVVVHEGVYREWVKPQRGGTSDQKRIVYSAAPGEKVTIKGSEEVKGWEPLGNGVWSVKVDNELFGDFNPYEVRADGDWMDYRGIAYKKHLGEVYLNGRSFFEVESAEAVGEVSRRDEIVDHATGLSVPYIDPDQTIYVWHAEVDDRFTTIWANFHDYDPNAELVEINVRKAVFYPDKNHLNYITVRGFEIAQAACPWTPPTADQVGMVGPNWAKGWIIEDNVLHDAKCSAISIGKEGSTGDNWGHERGDKLSHQYQIEAVHLAKQIGWDKENIGSHVIRRNKIYDCGQNGIVGHLGCVFSVIEDNEIYRIALKREFYGYEIGGIKLHAAIDVQIRRNLIHDCSMGIWLDWQTQGTRISQNVMFDNSRDLFVEVSHGPYLVDNNVLASTGSIEIMSQGGAYVHNLILGAVRVEPVLDRSTPYHFEHSTDVAGYSFVFSGDDRWVNNIFLGAARETAYAPGNPAKFDFGTSIYNGYPDSMSEYKEELAKRAARVEEHAERDQPVYVSGNVYLAGATPFELEKDAVTVSEGAARVRDTGKSVVLDIDLPEEASTERELVTAERDLPPVRVVGLPFETPEGRPAQFVTDILGQSRDAKTVAGPLSQLVAGEQTLVLWERAD